LISTQVATALAAIANEEAVAALMQELEGDYFIARADAVYALGIIGDQSFIPAITKACSDPHERVPGGRREGSPSDHDALALNPALSERQAKRTHPIPRPIQMSFQKLMRHI